jgi:hypothetical protein
MSWKVLRSAVNEIVPIFDDHAHTLTLQSGRMREAFGTAFLSAARGFSFDTGETNRAARVRHADTVDKIRLGALGAVAVMKTIRSTVDGLKGYSSEMKKAKRRLLSALDTQVQAIHGVIEDADDAKHLLLGPD